MQAAVGALLPLLTAPASARAFHEQASLSMPHAWDGVGC
jgi:hypothetical protein